MPAPESAHAIAAVIAEAEQAREAGKKRVILFNLSGHGLLDLSAYETYLHRQNSGRLNHSPNINKSKSMKTQSIRLVLAAALAALPGLLQAQPAAHYVPGVEGIKGASLPPPGFYLRDYNYFYAADQLNNASGNKNGPAELRRLHLRQRAARRSGSPTRNSSAATSAWTRCCRWFTSSSAKRRAARSTAAPLASAISSPKARFRGISNNLTFRLGSGVWAPTGDSATPPTSTRAGSGFWTPMHTAGATWYIDEAKTWAVSALNRYEFNTEQRDTHDHARRRLTRWNGA